ncbi:MAG TPA: G1 family glutamic endopeptidase [Methanomicrobiales archaeon]|nr:G1 family glutamic endopeptidase [Methanomicrobiales archaeon]
MARIPITIGLLFIGLILISLAGCVGIPVTNTTGPTVPPSLPNTTTDLSRNWAGYIVQTSFSNPDVNAVDSVEGRWNVATVDCPSDQLNYSASIWVGIGGYSTNGIAQIGTDSDCIDGTPVYLSWYEMYPANKLPVNLTVNPGDEVYAKVESAGNNAYKFTLTDLNTSDTKSFTVASNNVSDSSAEWIVEAPLYNNQIVPLPDFNPVEFRNASVTVKGVKGPINGGTWEYQESIMAKRTGVLKASPTPLESNGTRFMVTWEHT